LTSEREEVSLLLEQAKNTIRYLESVRSLFQ